MSLISRLAAGVQTRAGEPRGSVGLTNGGLRLSWSKAGRIVTNENVTGIAAWWAAVWLIADQGGTLPLRVYRRELDGRRGKPVPGAWQNRLLSQPNPESSGVDTWTVVLAHLESWGNAYLGKEKALGRVVHLWPIRPDRVVVRREGGIKKFDVVEDDGSVHTYTSADIVHIKHRSLDGFIGANPIEVHRNTLGIALALDDFAGDVFKNRAVPLGVLSVKGRIDDDNVRKTMRREWKDRFNPTGRRTQEIAILDDEAKFTPVSMPLIDAQFLEQRQYSVADIARLVGVAPELIGGESGGSMTYSNVQARRADLLQFVLWSRLKRIEGALFGDRDLFPTNTIGPGYDDTDFLRGDPAEQYAALRVATGNKPILTQDEARGEIGREPLGGSAAELDSKPAAMPAAGDQTQQTPQEDPA